MSEKNETQAVPDVAAIEQQLNKYSYLNVPLGSTLAQMLYISFIEKKQQTGIDHFFKNVLTLLFYLFKGPSWTKNKPTPDSYPEDIVLFTLLDRKDTLVNMVQPIVDIISSRQACLILAKDTAAANRITGNIEAIELKNLPGYSLQAWRRSTRKVRYKLAGEIIRLKKQHTLNISSSIELYVQLVSNMHLLHSLHQFFQKVKPAFIITEYDRSIIGSCIVLTAKQNGIRTTTLMHGVINHPIGYVPVLADTICVWGERQKSILSSLGVHHSVINITGATQLRKINRSDRIGLLKDYGLDPVKKTILLATNPIAPSERKQLADIFCKSISSLKTPVNAVIRIHPSESLEFYQEYISAYPEIQFHNGKSMAYNDAFILPDYVCVFNSAFGTESILQGIPVFVIDISDSNNGNALELIREAKCISAKNYRDLTSHIDFLLNNETKETEYKNTLTAYGDHYCKYYYTEAANEIAKVVHSTPGTNA